MVIHQSPKTQLEWLDQGAILRKTFKGFVYGEELKSAFMLGYEKVKNKKGCKWLSDNRFLDVYTEEDIAWINDVWLTSMIDAGWKYWAILEPEGLVGQLTMEEFKDFYAEKGIILKIFHSMREAEEWLENQH